MENPFELILEKLESIEHQLQQLQEENKAGISDTIMDMNEICSYIKYQKTSIYGLIQKKKIPYIKAGGRILFRKSEIDNWLDKGRRKTKDEINDAVDQYL